jgi:hypothetical protein
MTGEAAPGERLRRRSPTLADVRRRSATFGDERSFRTVRDETREVAGVNTGDFTD